MSEAVYVVQAQRDAEDDSGVLWRGWEDIATVKVPARTHRKTVVEKALGQASTDLSGGPILVRVLDEQSARETKVETEQPPPRLKLS
jgi:hypothetical protein